MGHISKKSSTARGTLTAEVGSARGGVYWREACVEGIRGAATMITVWTAGVCQKVLRRRARARLKGTRATRADRACSTTLSDGGLRWGVSCGL